MTKLKPSILQKRILPIKLNIAVQINGKTRQIIKIEEGLTKESILELVKNNEKVKKNLSGKKIIREIYVPGKIVNLVVE